MAVGRLVAPLVWSMVSDRPDFGDLLDGHHPSWIVAFERRRNARVLFAFAGDGA
jgi:hypothetical protein